MKTIHTQIVKNTYCKLALVPVSQEDIEALGTFKPNQILTNKVSGCRKRRSVLQNKWLHSIFRLVAQNIQDPDWDSPEKVKRNVKMAMKFFSDDVVVSGNKVWFELRSFAFDALSQDEANHVYNEAKAVCAKKLGVSVESLEAEAQKD